MAWLCCFRGVSTLTALGLLAEIGDFSRFANARELMSFLGLTVSEYSSGERRSRGSITKTGNGHARRLLIEAAWHYQRPTRLSTRIRANAELVPADPLARAWQAQIRLHERHRYLTGNGKLPTVATVAVARELCGFPLGRKDPPTPTRGGAETSRLKQGLGELKLGWAAGADPVRNLDFYYAIPDTAANPRS